MGKLFKLALEEAVVEEPSIVENVPVEEAVQNAEELAKTDSEIQQDIAAVEELMEEKAKLEEQAITNDELLSNPDAVVTAADVEVSEETRTEVQYSLGYTSSMGKIRLSQESIANDVRSNPRKYLAISNEDIKDTIKKIVDKIKQIISDIVKKLDIYISRAIFSFKNYEKTIEENFKFLSATKTKPSSTLAKSAQGILLDKNQATINFTVLGNVFLSRTFEQINALLAKITKNEKSADAAIDDEIDLKSYGMASNLDKNYQIHRVYGTTGLASHKYQIKVGVFVTKLEQDLTASDLNRFNIDNIRVDAIATYSEYKKAIKDAKNVFDKAIKAEKSGLAELNKLSSEWGDDEYGKASKDYLNILKNNLSVLVPFLIKEYIATIKAYVEITDELVKVYKAAEGNEKVLQNKKLFEK